MKQTDSPTPFNTPIGNPSTLPQGERSYESINLSSTGALIMENGGGTEAETESRHYFWQRRQPASSSTDVTTGSDGLGQKSNSNVTTTDASPYDHLFVSAQFSVAPPYEELSNFQASMHILKGSVGTGVLAMPTAIRDSGLFFGTLSIMVVSLIVTHSMHLLLESAQYLRQLHSVRRAAAVEKNKLQRLGQHIGASNIETELRTSDPFDGSAMLAADEVRLDYYETVRMSFLKATPYLRRWAWLSGVLNICLIAGQLGFLGVYQIFVAENTKAIVDYYQPTYAPKLWMYLLGVFALIVPLVFIKTLDKLAFLSSLANVLGLGGLVLIILYCVQDLQAVTEQPLIRSMDTLPLAFGVIIFAFESINIILPIENQMRHKRDMMGWAGVLSLNMTIVTAIYAAVGFFGYLRFGQEVKGAITYSIPMQPWFFALSKPMYTVSIFVSYTLQFYVAFTVLWEFILPKLRDATTRTLFWGDFFLRMGIVTFALVLSMTIPFLDLLISFMGAFAGAAIVLIFPPLVHSVNMWMQYGNTTKCWLIITKNILMILFGIVGALVGGGVSLNAIIVKVRETYF